MADKRKTPERDEPETPEAPRIPQVVENVPSIANQISGLASAAAPFVYFDSVPFAGQFGGVGQITLTAGRHIGFAPGAGYDHVVTAHIRAPLASLRALREAIDKVEKEILATAAHTPDPGEVPSGMAH